MPSQAGYAGTQQPSELSDSYFPSASAATGRSNISAEPSEATSSTATSPSTETPPSVAETPSFKFLNSPIGNYGPMPALAREFPKPADHIDVAAQLAKRPLPRSLHSSIQVAALRDVRKTPGSGGSHGTDGNAVEQGEAQARAKKLEEAKKMWASWK